MATKKRNTTTKQPRNEDAIRNVVEHAGQLDALLRIIPRTAETAPTLKLARQFAVQIMLDVADEYGNIRFAGEAA